MIFLYLLLYRIRNCLGYVEIDASQKGAIRQLEEIAVSNLNQKALNIIQKMNLKYLCSQKKVLIFYFKSVIPS